MADAGAIQLVEPTRAVTTPTACRSDPTLTSLSDGVPTKPPMTAQFHRHPAWVTPQESEARAAPGLDPHDKEGSHAG